VRWVLLLVVLSSVAYAGPPKPVRKAAPPGLDAEQVSAYVEAIIADKAGDYDGARSRYQRIKDVAAITYNMADLERRMEDYKRAIELYKKYLDLAPNAPDRAAVQRLIDQLAKTPMTLVVDGDDLDAVVFLDGKPAGSSPLVTRVADGFHVVDRIGPDSYIHDTFEAKPLGYEHTTANSERLGNVVMSTPAYGGSWHDGDKTFQMNARFTLPPGRVDTYFMRPGRACSPLSFVVPADGLVYVYIDAPRENPKGGCTPIKVTAQKIAFPKVKK
jgi:tetratricopeptide (TPR) repeat protein